MSLLLGIDGGGTYTRAILVEATGRVIGCGRAGPSNYHNVGVDTAAVNLRAATLAAWAASGRPCELAAGAFLGLAGIKSGRDSATMTAAAEGVGLAPVGTLHVTNDLYNALAGGLDGAPGIALIAGTGCNGLGRDATGGCFTCGGWGWLLGDEGAGFGLVAEGLRAAVRSADGRAPATRLLASAVAFFGLANPDELLACLYADTWQPGNVAAFAPVVIRLAAEGDATAQRVLKKGAVSLAEIVGAIARTLSFPAGPDVVLLGGCLTSGAPYQPLVEDAIRRTIPNARLRSPIYDPLHGAALNALRHAGILPPPALRFPTV